MVIIIIVVVVGSRGSVVDKGAAGWIDRGFETNQGQEIIFFSKTVQAGCWGTGAPSRGGGGG
jgi:hypothetical protein